MLPYNWGRVKRGVIVLPYNWGMVYQRCYSVTLSLGDGIPEVLKFYFITGGYTGLPEVLEFYFITLVWA